MMHTKEEHPENISQCWNFEAGECEYNNNCWFSHHKNVNNPSEFKCKTCDLIFKRKSEYFKHKKMNHIETVKSCRGYIEGSCNYDDQNCWFRHFPTIILNKNEENENSVHKDNDRKVLKRLIDKVEKLTKRIVEMEKT